MSSYVWPNEDGWPYPDPRHEEADPSGEIDEDILSLRAGPPHLFDPLAPLERQVICSRYGLEGHPVRSLKELQAELHLPRADLRQALTSGLAKLRTQLS